MKTYRWKAVLTQGKGDQGDKRKCCLKATGITAVAGVTLTCSMQCQAKHRETKSRLLLWADNGGGFDTTATPSTSRGITQDQLPSFRAVAGFTYPIVSLGSRIRGGLPESFSKPGAG